MSNFPTGKEHISFSELTDWYACSWRHKLKHVDKIDLFEPNPFVVFGSNIHKGCEEIINTRTVNIETILFDLKNDLLELSWKKEWGILETWLEEARNILIDIPPFLDLTFPNWECVSAEQKIVEDIEGTNIKFKGFIDGIIKVNEKGKDKIYIIDFKSSIFGWTRYKKQDSTPGGIQAQLRLYKHFYSLQSGVPLSDIRCGFVILKRKAKAGKHCEFFKISVGDETRKRTLKVVNNMINSIERRIALKNRFSCKFCDYYETEHCK